MPRGGSRPVRAFNMTKDGFVLLAMGFTGREALRFKLAYIQRFNEMEEQLRPVAIGPRVAGYRVAEYGFEGWPLRVLWTGRVEGRQGGNHGSPCGRRSNGPVQATTPDGPLGLCDGAERADARPQREGEYCGGGDGLVGLDEHQQPQELQVGREIAKGEHYNRPRHSERDQAEEHRHGASAPRSEERQGQ